MKSKKEPRVTNLMPATTPVVVTPIPIPHKEIPTVFLNTPPEAELPVEADRVGNLTQKERAAYKVGVTREKLLASIKDGLEATKMEVVTGEDGRSHARVIPDLDKRLKATEMGLKFFGDMKEIQIPGQTTNIKNITYHWGPVTAVDKQVIHE